MRQFSSIVALCAAVIFVTFFSGITSARAQGYYDPPTGERINEIHVVGTQRIEPATVLTYLDVKVGDNMTEETFSRALKSLFGTGLFADVTLRQKAHVLEVQVTENPVINQIAFEGNDKIKDDDLTAEIQLRPRQVFSRNKVQEDVNRLYALYRRQGRFSANIEPKVIKLDQNRVNLVFEIDEGPVTKVSTIRFIGNAHYTDSKLRTVVSTKEAHWYRFLSTDDRYDPDRLSYDQELLRRFYLSQGYADFEVSSAVAELSKDRQRFFITITMNEGERYKVGKIAIQSNLQHFDATILNKYVTFKSGHWYNASEVQTTVDKMTTALGDMQYAFINVKPDVKRNRDVHTVDISFQVSEAPRVFVERIDIHGNVRTLDKVIRRQIQLVEGDPFNKTKLSKSEQKIKDLGYFESVKVTPQPGSAPDKTVIDVDVAEQSTGELSVGAGFSTADGPLADTSIKERNLLGKGQDLGLSATIAAKRTSFNLGFTEPYFMDRDFSTGFDLFHTTQNLIRFSQYDQSSTGGDIRVGYPLSEKWRQSLRYTLAQNDISNVESTASLFIRDQEGSNVTSSVSQEITYDARDSTLFPTNGLYSWFDTTVAGAGGSAKYVSGKVGSSWYYPVADKWVLNILGEGGAIRGYAGHDLRIDERFFLGGTTLRGFQQAGAGPRDINTDDSLGGDYFYRGTAELSFPIGLPDELGVLGHAFTDVGSLWGLDNVPAGVNLADVKDNNAFRGAGGVGISWRSPLGPIRVDLAEPYVKQGYDKAQIFSFNFGTHF
jgi:outer membrane protein insertion porin family